MFVRVDPLSHPQEIVQRIFYYVDFVSLVYVAALLGLPMPDCSLDLGDASVSLNHGDDISAVKEMNICGGA